MAAFAGIPTGYQAYVSFALILISGFLIGAAVKKAITSAILFIVGVAVASFSGITAFSYYARAVTAHLPAILASAYTHFGASITAFPILFLLGAGIGFWKG
ncbi:MAG: hypothetical protein QW767_03535 [Thermoprotei archaeon]